MKDALKPLHDRKQKEKKMDNSDIRKIQRRYIKLSIYLKQYFQIKIETEKLPSIKNIWNKSRGA